MVDLLSRILGHVLRVLTVCLPRLLENLLCVCLDEVRLRSELFERRAHLSFLDYVDVVSFIALGEETTATALDCGLEMQV